MRKTETAPSPVTLAEWLRAGLCPPEALHEAGLLFVDLKLAPWRAKLGTDVRWARADDHSPEFGRMEVNADSIWFWWWECPRTEGWSDDDTDQSGMAEWWNSLPLADRPIEKDWDDLPHVGRARIVKHRWPLDAMVNQWTVTPEAERPKHFPLDPVVQAWGESRDLDSPVRNSDARPDGELSLQDYIPQWQRYRQDVRQAVEKDEREKNVEDVHTAFERANAGEWPRL